MTNRRVALTNFYREEFLRHIEHLQATVLTEHEVNVVFEIIENIFQIIEIVFEPIPDSRGRIFRLAENRPMSGQ